VLTKALAIIPADDACQIAMYKNGRLRLLMSLAGFELLGDDVLGGSWIVPSSIPSQKLEETRTLIEKFRQEKADAIDGEDPRDLLRRARKKDSSAPDDSTAANINFGSDSEGEESLNDNLFPPNIRSKSAGLQALKQSRRGKKKTSANDEGDNQGLDEEALEAWRLARLENSLNRMRKIKSDVYVHASDDETDEEADRQFFAREEERRLKQADRIQEALDTGDSEPGSNVEETRAVSGRRKRKSNSGRAAQNKRRRSSSRPAATEEDRDEVIIGDASSRPQSPLLSTPPTPAEDGLGPGDKFQNGTVIDDDDEVPIAIPARRPRVMGGFIIDDDSD
jgi:replication fork protection complex subunit Tof1/Swi1